MSFFSRDDTDDADRSQGFAWKRANLLSDEEMFEATVVSQQRRQRSDFLRKEKPRQQEREPPVPDHSTQGKSSSTETRKAVESESIPARLHILRTPRPGGPLEDMETLIPHKEKKLPLFPPKKVRTT